MVKPVTGLTQWGSVTSGSTADLDANFTAVKNAINDFNTYGNYLTDTGSANSIAVSLPANITGVLTDGLQIQVKVAATNTGATVLNYNAGGALAVKNPDGSALGATQLASSGIYAFAYRASDTSWILLTTQGTRGWVLISAKQANANTSIDFNNALSSTYDQYRLTITGLRPAGNSASVAIRFGNGNTPTYQTTGYLWGARWQSPTTGVDVGSIANSNATAVYMSSLADAGIYNGANAAFAAEVKLMGGNFNAPMMVAYDSTWLSGVGFVSISQKGGGYWNNNDVVTSVQVVPSNANITSGNFALYGLVKA